MKFCHKCGKQLDDSAMFCVGCGEKQAEPSDDDLKPNQAESDSENIAEIGSEENDSAESVDNTSENTADTSEEKEQKSENQDKNREYIGKTCSYCKTKITEDDEIVVCPACDIAHHKSCWEENGGCTTFGCSGKAQGTTVCYNCGADLTAEQMFCSKCGSPRAVQETPNAAMPDDKPVSFCKNCGAVILAGQEFCVKCGSRTGEINSATGLYAPSVVNSSVGNYTSVTVKKKPNVGKIVGIVVAVIAVLAIAVGFVVSNNKAKAIEEYKETAEEFSEACWTCGGNLEDVGNDIQTYWSKYINTYGTKVYYNGHYMYSIDDAVSYALSDNSSTVSLIKTEWSSIKSLYNKLKDIPDKNDNELKEIWYDVKAVYEAMEEMYDCVINVSGNYTTYRSNFADCDSELADSLEALDNELN